MYYVYIIKSLECTEKFYVGYTLSVEARMRKHNEGSSIYTKNYRPWILCFSCCFAEKVKALEFEKYLKSHSGRIFMRKHLI
jgi:putative endonuclease